MKLTDVVYGWRDVAMEVESDDDTVVVSRVLELARNHVPLPHAHSSGRRTTGVSEWVRKLYAHMVKWRADGWSWATIVALLEEAAVPLNNKRWNERDLRRAMTRERRRQEKRVGAGGKAPGPSEQRTPPGAARRGQGDWEGGVSVRRERGGVSQTTADQPLQRAISLKAKGSEPPSVEAMLAERAERMNEGGG